MPKLPTELEKRLSELYKSEIIVCSKCKHSKESHWWNGSGRIENSGYDACHSCDCDCMGDEVIEEYIEDHKYMTDFIAQALESQRKQIRSEVEEVFDDFRSSGEVDEKGMKKFGVANFDVGAKDIYDQVLSLPSLKEV